MAYWKNNNNSDAPVSNFNEAGFQIQRLNESWNKVKLLRTRGDLINWRWELEIIWSELSPDALLTDANWETNEYVRGIRSIDKLISLAVKKNRGKMLYDLLVKKEIFLRGLQNASGKGSSYKETDESIDF